METIEITCRDCGTTFERLRQRGRLPLRCPDCKDKIAAAQVALIVETKPGNLYSGPEELLRGTPNERPKGAEAQCPLCFRIYSSNASCENHKRYQKNEPATCVDPSTIGMIAREKRGIPIWTTPNTRIFT